MSSSASVAIVSFQALIRQPDQKNLFVSQAEAHHAPGIVEKVRVLVGSVYYDDPVEQALRSFYFSARRCRFQLLGRRVCACQTSIIRVATVARQHQGAH